MLRERPKYMHGKLPIEHRKICTQERNSMSDVSRNTECQQKKKRTRVPLLVLLELHYVYMRIFNCRRSPLLLTLLEKKSSAIQTMFLVRILHDVADRTILHDVADQTVSEVDSKHSDQWILHHVNFVQGIIVCVVIS